jgi:hypothetical protein
MEKIASFCPLNAFRTFGAKSTRSSPGVGIGISFTWIPPRARASLGWNDGQIFYFVFLLILDCYSNNFYFFEWAITTIGRNRSDDVDDIKPIYDLSKDRMLSVKPCSLFGMHDKKLTSIRIGTSVRHGEKSFFMRKLWMKFIFKFFTIHTFPSSTSTSRVTSLDHKISHHTMKYRTCIVATLCEFDEIFCCPWDFVCKDFERDITMVGVKRYGRILWHIYKEGNSMKDTTKKEGKTRGNVLYVFFLY